MLEFLKRLFGPPICPECGGKMKSDMYDMEIDCIVYTCRECSKEWI